MPPVLIGVDTGGTFTDFICYANGSLRVHKVLSDPDSPDRAIQRGLTELGLDREVAEGRARLVHGTTVATNAALENKGVKTLFVTNSGFTDILSIGRQARRELYNLCPTQQLRPVPEQLCRGLDTRVDASGAEIEPLNTDQLDELVENLDEDIEAVAVCFLFSYLNASAEQLVETALKDRCFVSISSKVLPEYGEYERGIATWLNASLGPVVSRYLKRLQELVPGRQLSVMQSAGGTISAAQASERAVDLLLSGPAGGLAAARYLSGDLHHQKLLTLDMGGTSTDVAMVDAEIRLTTEGSIGPYPVAVPMVDMHTIGAGGGSIAYLDAAGMLHLGPESAGADPGPACYGRGGERATLTDAHLCLGTLPSHLLLGGSMPLDREAAERAVQGLAQQMQAESTESVARGIVSMANQHMVQALRVISEQRGLDPADFSLCSFGGAGALHVCDLAELLGMQRAVVPLYAGIFSALGMLVAPRLREMSQGIQRPVAGLQQVEIDQLAEELAAQGRAELVQEGVPESEVRQQVSVDCRYQGQTFSLNISSPKMDDLATRFHREHDRIYGHSLDRNVELVTLRVSLKGPETPIQWSMAGTQRETAEPETRVDVHGIEQPVPCYRRGQLPPGLKVEGPALVVDEVSTLWLKPAWELEVSPQGHLLLSR